MKLINNILSKMFKEYKFPEFIFKKLESNWTDNDGNNLYHYASRHHDLFLFEKAKENNANITHINKEGLQPIHIYMRAGFVEKKVLQSNHKTFLHNLTNGSKIKKIIDKFDKENSERRELNFHLEFLDNLVKNGADINAFVHSPVREGQWGEGVATNSMENNRGSAIELLINLFWKKVLHATFNDEKQIEKYTEIYKKLENYGANVNLILEKSIWDETEIIRDAMQDVNSVIVSHFFINYIMGEKDLIAIKPLLADKSLDFALKDDNGNTVLHYLFDKINKKDYNIGNDKIIDVFLTIVENPAFDEEILKIKNGFRLEPLMLFSKKKNDLRQEFEKLVLKKRLEKKLVDKPIKTKVNKI